MDALTNPIRAQWELQRMAVSSRYTTSIYGSLPYPVVNWMRWLEVCYTTHNDRTETVLDYMALIQRSGIN